MKDQLPPLEWETLSAKRIATMRAKVPGGWLVAVYLSDGGGVTFYPDPEHLWDGGSLL